MIGFLILLFHTLGLISSTHALMSTRTSQGTIAWLIEKAAQGVQVYFLYDEIGCYDLPGAYIDALRTATAVVFVAGQKF